MPMFVLNTNVSRDVIPDNLLADLTSQLTKATKKPAEYIAIHIVPDQMMSFGGSKDPCALCSLHSIGRIGVAENKAYTKLIADVLSKRLNIPANRCYINFFDLQAANVGWNGSTFA
uniref:Macrophage migration inhibitory factor n=1 Tax=Leptobrachium leishanense TaxID=445787 RepID=A0A8C5LNR4_9ANUR